MKVYEILSEATGGSAGSGTGGASGSGTGGASGSGAGGASGSGAGGSSSGAPGSSGTGGNTQQGAWEKKYRDLEAKSRETIFKQRYQNRKNQFNAAKSALNSGLFGKIFRFVGLTTWIEPFAVYIDEVEKIDEDHQNGKLPDQNYSAEMTKARAMLVATLSVAIAGTFIGSRFKLAGTLLSKIGLPGIGKLTNGFNDFINAYGRHWLSTKEGSEMLSKMITTKWFDSFLPEPLKILLDTLGVNAVTVGGTMEQTVEELVTDAIKMIQDQVDKVPGAKGNVDVKGMAKGATKIVGGIARGVGDVATDAGNAAAGAVMGKQSSSGGAIPVESIPKASKPLSSYAIGTQQQPTGNQPPATGTAKQPTYSDLINANTLTARRYRSPVEYDKSTWRTVSPGVVLNPTTGKLELSH